jgi:hypothetical protein
VPQIYDSQDASITNTIFLPEHIDFYLANFYSLFIYLEPYVWAAVTEHSKARTVFVRSNTGIGGSNPTKGMDKCLFCVCVT